MDAAIMTRPTRPTIGPGGCELARLVMTRLGEDWVDASPSWRIATEDGASIASDCLSGCMVLGYWEM